MRYIIREIEEKDNKRVEEIIRGCLTEFGANHEGTAWADPYLGQFSKVYALPGRKYWVAEDENGTVTGGVGIGELPGAEGVCELQKMYCIPEVRGKGVSHMLMETALSYAREHYKSCYLETLGNMLAAHRFYEKYGFTRIQKPLADTGHYACDVLYMKQL